MRALAIFILALAVVYGGLCGVGAKAFAFAAQDAASTLDAATAEVPPCHAAPSTGAVPDAPKSKANCCEIRAVFAVSTAAAFDMGQVCGDVSHFFVAESFSSLFLVRDFAMAEISVERTAFPELRILYSSFLI